MGRVRLLRRIAALGSVVIALCIVGGGCRDESRQPAPRGLEGQVTWTSFGEVIADTREGPVRASTRGFHVPVGWWVTIEAGKVTTYAEYQMDLQAR